MLEMSARRATGCQVASLLRRTTVGLVLVAVTALLATACAQEEATAPKPTPTPLARLNTTAMQVPRIDFCKLVPGSAVSDALGGKPDTSSSYGNGDGVDLPGVGKAVVHEIGCSWGTDAGETARAWVFARPVDAAYARKAIASSRTTKGCRLDPGPAFGRPALTQTCHLSDGTTRVRHAGLFGQTWLTCEVAVTGADQADLRGRTDAWCVEVANALNTAG
jgi:hypothetical protein